MELHELFDAYYACRRNKRGTINALAFEINYESQLIQLHREILEGTYRIGPSIAFIVERPVKREVFAGDFRDRIVHHYIIGKLNAILEKTFIHDSYSCRTGKGTLFGIRRIHEFMRQANQNQAKDAYVLKLDIQGFFMNIRHDILLGLIRNLLDAKYQYPDKEELYRLCEIVVRNDPTINCFIKGKRSDWVGLPKSKSLFFSPSGTGLPIGNLTSQIFANLYLHELDIFAKKTLKIRFYGRYVDDFVLIHEDVDFLRSTIGKIHEFLSEHLALQLHPKKIYFQHICKGVAFLGVFILPDAIYIGKKTKNGLHCAITEINHAIDANIQVLHHHESRTKILSCLNSYLGLMRHHDSMRLRRKLLHSLRSSFWNYFYISGKYGVVVPKSREHFYF